MEVKLTPKRKEIMELMQFDSLFSVLRFYPYRYEILKTKELTMADHEQKVTVEGFITTEVKNEYLSRKLTKTSFFVRFLGNDIKITLFNRFGWAKILKKGMHLVVTGKFNAFYNEINAASFFIGSLDGKVKIQSVYSLSSSIKAQTYQNFVSFVYNSYQDSDEIKKEFIPEFYKTKYHLCSLKDALHGIHMPINEEELKQANRYLKYEEFLRFCLLGAMKRRLLSLDAGIKRKNIDFTYVHNFIHSLPFKLTEDQKMVSKEILDDIKSVSSMSRLLQGDVGSGKTIVALIALIANASAGFQGAIMAPTDILTKQHYHYIKETLNKFDSNIEVVLLVSDMKIDERKNALKLLKESNKVIAVGTHSLIQDTVTFSKLGLAIIDEQHRFGVKQRGMLKEKGRNIDVLYMSATPIPRTLASTIYMDMDVSTIQMYPNSSRSIQTFFVEDSSIHKITKNIKEYLKTEQKIYVVCPCIDESPLELKDVNTIRDEFIKLFPSTKILMLHGKMASKDKENILNEFSNGNGQILISTTVVEVGINVKGANMMILYNAERFGLAQIHQLRGRIARYGEIGYCYLLSNNENEDVKERLHYISTCNDGFTLSEYDLKRRGAGDMLGIMQAGKSPFKIASLVDDFAILKAASDDAKEIMKNKAQFIDTIDEIIKMIHNLEKYVD